MSEPDLTIHASYRDLLALAGVLAKSIEGHVGAAPPEFTHGWLACCKAISEIAERRKVETDALLAEAKAQRVPRLKSCVEAWPGCVEGEYDPRCCRFPKSCSCDVYDPERVPPEAVEDVS